MRTEWYRMDSSGRHDLTYGVWWRSWSFGFYINRRELEFGLGPIGLHWHWGA